jgi:hypothetical protein
MHAAAEAQPVVALTVGDASAAEAGPQTGSFTVTRSADGNTAAPLSVWVTVSGSATDNQDYTAAPWSVRGSDDYSINIPGGQLAQLVTLTPLKDNLVEGTQTFGVMLRGPGDVGHDYTIGAETAGEIAITDDVAVVTLAVNDDQAAEAGPQTGSFTVTRSANGNTATPLEVWVTVSGSATHNSDYTVSPWSLRGGGDFSINIPGGQLAQVVTLTPVFDQLIEGDETFAVQLRPPGDVNNDYTIGAQANGQITIRDFVQLIFKDSFEDL